MQDPKLIYSLEVRVIDLEQKVSELESLLNEITSGRVKGTDPSVVPLPPALLKRINEGEHPVRVVRQFRLMTQKELGELCGIRPNHISAIERGMSYGLKTAKRLADALAVPVDILT
ncbi:helix-turn-helix transcriptional regulator [Hyphomonas sp. WL0036]|uniref:helix-turn-helix domain-containing protein n=1 Tax=Hyphomonas sediminis TaxID=2866160 RepID=UPI001C820835|nr:helix-turn-helix transcriptional regulator [Hyphomonas sediminis]MBY9067696.1 helix-turn-helix transcriptional regulator [Hyphomonas sediminis]